MTGELEHFIPPQRPHGRLKRQVTAGAAQAIIGG
jgi:hypothetical protein